MGGGILARAGKRAKRRLPDFGGLLFVVYMVQTSVMFLRVQAPLAAALHPVLALIEFALGVALVRSVWPLARTVESQPSARADLEPAAAS